MVKFIFIFLSITLLLLLSCRPVKNRATEGLPPYSPTSKTLFDSISSIDSLFFDAYNTCKMDVISSLISEDLEFYHDLGGLSTSKPDIVQAIKNNICGKVRRELLPGSIEVYPIPGYGAVQFGAHRFHNLIENSTSGFARFVSLWKLENGQWKLSRVISLHSSSK